MIDEKEERKEGIAARGLGSIETVSPRTETCTAEAVGLGTNEEDAVCMSLSKDEQDGKEKGRDDCSGGTSR